MDTVLVEATLDCDYNDLQEPTEVETYSFESTLDLDCMDLNSNSVL